MKRRDVKDFKKETGIELEDIHIDITIKQSCGSSDFNSIVQIEADDMFELVTKLDINGAEKYIDFIKDEENLELLQSKDSDTIKEALQAASSIEGFSFLSEFYDNGIGAKITKRIFGDQTKIVLDSIMV